MSKIENTPQVNEICRISKGTKITGVISSSSDIRIDGTFEGDIYTTGKLVVGESSLIKGRIACQSSDIWGKVEGHIFVDENLTLKSSAIFKGALKVSKLCIEMGVIFNGTCDMINHDQFVDFVKSMKIADQGTEPFKVTQQTSPVNKG